MLSKKLLDALKKDRDYYGDEWKEPRDFYPHLMALYDELIMLENHPTMINYDRWDLKRPLGIHSL